MHESINLGLKIMVFQHYTTDDFIGYEYLLNRPFTLENVRALITHLNPALYVRRQIHDNIKWWDVSTNEFGKHVIFNCTFSEVLFEGNGVYHPEFVDMNAWVYHGGLPIIADARILREDHPELDHIVGDINAAQYLYQLTYGKN